MGSWEETVTGEDVQPERGCDRIASPQTPDRISREGGGRVDAIRHSGQTSGSAKASDTRDNDDGDDVRTKSATTAEHVNESDSASDARRDGECADGDKGARESQEGTREDASDDERGGDDGEGTAVAARKNLDQASHEWQEHLANEDDRCNPRQPEKEQQEEQMRDADDSLFANCI